MQIETFFYIILAGIIALLLALFQYLYKTKKRTKVKILLAFFRFLTLFAILLLLINPKFHQTTYVTQKPKLIVAVDNSESIQFLDQDKKARRFVTLLQKHPRLNEHFDLNLFRFGKEVKELDSLSFTERQTNPSLLFEGFFQVYNNTTAPLILISDGNQTYGSDYEYAAQKFKEPIFPVILGDTISYTDLKIEQLNVNKYVYLKNKFPVEIIAVYNGEEDITSELQITSAHTTVFKQQLSFNKATTSRVVNINLPADRAGVHSYKAELKPVLKEINVVNNVKNFAVEVIDQKTNVAIVSDIIHPDIGALKKTIESNEQRQVSVIKPLDFIEQSEEFQQVILYQPNQNFKAVYEEIEKTPVNIFTILGTKTNWSAFNAFQPYVQQVITNQQEDFQANLNLDYNVFGVEDLKFSNLPPLQTEFGASTFTVPTDVMLYKTINGIQIDEPLLATYEIDQKRAAVLNGEGLWRWRAQSYLNEESFDPFDEFVGKIIQFLDTNKKRRRLEVSYESFYNGNDNIIITAQYFNKNYEFDTSANLEISLKNHDKGQTQTLPFILKQSNYQVDLSGIEAGNYSFKVTSQDAHIYKAGEFTILEYNVEQQFLNANVPKLRNLASINNGKAYFIDDANAIIDQLLEDDRFVAIQKSTKKIVPLIDWEILLIVIVISLSSEWFVRKYHGLT